MVKRIGILTGGGDAPGLNAVIRAVARVSEAAGVGLYGFKNGFSGLIKGIHSADKAIYFRPPAKRAVLFSVPTTGTTHLISR